MKLPALNIPLLLRIIKMENKSKSEQIRLALAERGPSTAAELAEGVDIEIKNVGALLAYDLKHGRLVRGWRGKIRIYGLPGTIDNPSPSPSLVPLRRAKPYVSHRTQQSKAVERMRMPDIEPGDNFTTLSEKARQCEQANNFTDAAPLWLIAADFATKEANQFWCRSRSDFCVRGWKYPEVNQ
ncbi:Uncharacterised protein [Serratia marcescens]|nr:Uncharacterised protein [Serratia marcescens]